MQFTQRSLVGVAADDGKLLWQYDKPANRQGIICSTPVLHDSEVFASSAYSTGGGLLKLSKDDKGGVKFDEVYFTKNMQSQHGGMILDRRRPARRHRRQRGGQHHLPRLRHRKDPLERSQREEGLDCRRRRPPLLSARGRPGDPHRTEQDGLLEHGRFKQPDRSKANAWPHPVIANGKLYLRDQDVLLVYDVKAK